MAHSMNDVSFQSMLVRQRETKKGKISSTRKKQSKEITVMLHRRCQSSTSDSLHVSCCFAPCSVSFPVAGKVSPYPCPDSRLWLTVIRMVHNIECLKNISWPPKKKHKNQVQDHFSALLAELVPPSFGLSFRLETKSCVTPSSPHTILYLRLVSLMNFRITLLQWDKSKEDPDTRWGEWSLRSLPTVHALTDTCFFFLSSHSPNAVNVHTGWIYRFANNPFSDFA